MIYYDEWLYIKMKVYGSYIQLVVHLQGLLFGKNEGNQYKCFSDQTKSMHILVT